MLCRRRRGANLWLLIIFWLRFQCSWIIKEELDCLYRVDRPPARFNNKPSTDRRDAATPSPPHRSCYYFIYTQKKTCCVYKHIKEWEHHHHIAHVNPICVPWDYCVVNMAPPPPPTPSKHTPILFIYSFLWCCFLENVYTHIRLFVRNKILCWRALRRHTHMPRRPLPSPTQKQKPIHLIYYTYMITRIVVLYCVFVCV